MSHHKKSPHCPYSGSCTNSGSISCTILYKYIYLYKLRQQNSARRRMAQHFSSRQLHRSTAHPCSLALVGPISPACKRVKVEVVFAWTLSHVPSPFCYRHATIRGIDKVGFHVWIV